MPLAFQKLLMAMNVMENYTEDIVPYDLEFLEKITEK